jgi:hypothetical protein
MGTTISDLGARRERRWLRSLTSNRFALVAGVLVILLVLMALLAPLIAPHDPKYIDPSIRLLGPGPGQQRSGLVSFAFADVHAHDVVTFADEDGLALRGGHHCNQPLMRKLGLTSTTRASVYIYNTAEEIDVLVASLRRILKFFGA